MAEVEYFVNPLIKEILEQHRLMLEIHRQLLEVLSQSPLIFQEESGTPKQESK